MPKEVFVYTGRFELENGECLAGFELAYQTWGKRNVDDSNIIWVCHALTGNTDVIDWWPGMIGDGAALDPEKHFIICANMLGSCYGSTHALSINPDTGTPYYHSFPLLTNRDMVRAFDALREALQIKNIKLILGGSMGGQHALEWAVIKPDLFEYLAPVATNAQHSAWGIAFNETQRMSIEADSTWLEQHAEAGSRGMKAARAAALLSYRSYAAYQTSQEEPEDSNYDAFRASSYQQYQGNKIVQRFNAFAYWTLSKAMDSQNLGRGRGGVEQALQSIKAKTLVIAIDSDILFPPLEQQFIAEHIPNAQYEVVRSPKGHDGFLIEITAISDLLKGFINA
ncbi:MAG: homoserine O-acetyltransferase [Bacteroidota bacterium]